ncbi:hypothetical protein ACKWTF_015251 [Chironomus riparius]
MLKELFGRFCFCYDLTKGNLIFAWIQLLSSISFAVLMIVLLLGHKTIFLEVDLITFKIICFLFLGMCMIIGNICFHFIHGTLTQNARIMTPYLIFGIFEIVFIAALGILAPLLFIIVGFLVYFYICAYALYINVSENHETVIYKQEPAKKGVSFKEF